MIAPRQGESAFVLAKYLKGAPYSGAVLMLFALPAETKIPAAPGRVHFLSTADALPSSQLTRAYPKRLS